MTFKEKILRDATLFGLTLTPISAVLTAVTGAHLLLTPALAVDVFVAGFYTVWALGSFASGGRYRGRWLGDRKDSPLYACHPYLVIGPGFHRRIAERNKSATTANVATLERDAGFASTYSDGQIRYLTDAYIRDEIDLPTFERRVKAALLVSDEEIAERTRGPVGVTGAMGPTGSMWDPVPSGATGPPYPTATGATGAIVLPPGVRP